MLIITIAFNDGVSIFLKLSYQLLESFISLQKYNCLFSLEVQRGNLNKDEALRGSVLDILSLLY